MEAPAEKQAVALESSRRKEGRNNIPRAFWRDVAGRHNRFDHRPPFSCGGPATSRVLGISATRLESPPMAAQAKIRLGTSVGKIVRPRTALCESVPNGRGENGQG
jgi:hypothetical protein